jgi:hypothetical protein
MCPVSVPPRLGMTWIEPTSAQGRTEREENAAQEQAQPRTDPDE